jgi:hypothetical protein
VSELPETNVTRSADGTALIDDVFGRGPRDLVRNGVGGGSAELLWEEPGSRRLTTRLGNFCRVIRPDLRGTGASEGDR